MRSGTCLCVEIRFRSIRNLLRILFLACALFWLAMTSAGAQPSGDPVSRATIGAISGALQSRDFAKAEELAKAALASHPQDYRLWTLRGMSAAGLGNLRLALSHYQHALKLSPAYLPALEGESQTAFQLGDASAKPALLKILAQRSDDATAHAMLGVLDFRTRNCEDAVLHFQKATAVISGQRQTLTQYAMCLSVLERNDEAVTQFANTLALEPGQLDARYNLALAQWNAHRAEDALETLQPLLNEGSVNADAFALAADIHESKNDSAQSVDLLRSAILANPRNVNAYLQFAMISYDHASPQVGIDILNAGLSQLPNEPRLYLVRGVLLTQFGEFTRAESDFETASRIDPQLHFLRAAEGIVQSQRHDAPRAIASFRAAVKAHPDEAYDHYLLAEALQGESKPAGSPEFKEMVGEAEQALRLEPRMAAAHDLLGAVYIGAAETRKAIEHSRAALAIDANDQQAIYHLILALRKTEDKNEVPVLVKKLMQIQRESRSRDTALKKFSLYVVRNQAGTMDR
jgi:tetratricopeptide (TPR) repeat protein